MTVQTAVLRTLKIYPGTVYCNKPVILFFSNFMHLWRIYNKPLNHSLISYAFTCISVQSDIIKWSSYARLRKKKRCLIETLKLCSTIFKKKIDPPIYMYALEDKHWRLFERGHVLIFCCNCETEHFFVALCKVNGCLGQWSCSLKICSLH